MVVVLLGIGVLAAVAADEATLLRELQRISERLELIERRLND